MGVFPFGAQVRRIEGRSETPLSSWKSIQAFRRREFFLQLATVDSTTASPFPRPAAGRAWRAAAASNPSHPVSSTHVPGDSSLRSVAPSPRPHGVGSTNPYRTHARGHPRATPCRSDATAFHSTSACGPHGPRPSSPPVHFASNPRTNGSRFVGLSSVHGQFPPKSFCQRQIAVTLSFFFVGALGNLGVEQHAFACAHTSPNDSLLSLYYARLSNCGTQLGSLGNRPRIIPQTRVRVA